MPERIRIGNGVPFASADLLGLNRGSHTTASILVCLPKLPVMGVSIER